MDPTSTTNVKELAGATADREDGVLVDDEDAEHCESDPFTTQTTQKHVQLLTYTTTVHSVQI